MKQKKFRIRVVGENDNRLLSRILIILNRKNLKILYIHGDMNIKNNLKNEHQYIIDLECFKEQLIQIKKLIEKLIGIICISYHHQPLLMKEPIKNI
ncbi:acetolactate synthase [Blattabacterium cuenoti]|uniref:acetolactate synthase n=1 Tax=Blattabacterium cuenoti TaxID=1653831 RepID=UPI00163CACC4|nr:acetolactate synthase [Blattabacterium cuenoti]